MKKPFYFLAIISFMLISPMKAQTGASDDPFKAVEGTINTFLNNVTNIYYTFKMPCDGTITFSSNTGQSFYLDMINYTNYDNYYHYFYTYDTVSLSAKKDDSLRIRINSNSNSLISWILSVKTGIDPGASCNNPLEAKLGDNLTDNSNGDQWFEYTPNQTGLLTVSTCGLTNEDTYMQFLNSCDNSVGYSDDDCNAQSNFSTKVVSGETYYINWRNNYTDGVFNWNMSMSALASGTDITDFTIYSNDSGAFIVTREPVINTVNHTITAYVPRDFDLNDYISVMFQTSPGAGISYNDNNLPLTYIMNGQHFYYWNGIFNNPSYIFEVTSQDDANTQEWTLTLLHEAALLNENSFITYVVEGDTATIDELTHTVYVEVSSTTPTWMYTTFTSSPMSKIYLDDSLYSNQTAHDIFYDDTTHFTIISESGINQDWQVITTLIKGQNCELPIIATEGITNGNGQYTQYFSYTADESVRVVVESNYTDPYIYIYTGACNSLVYVASGNGAVFNAVVGETYHIRVQGFYNSELHITKNGEIAKEIIDFETYSSIYGYEYANIDTVDNTVTLSVGSRLDLTNLNYDFNLLFSNSTWVSIDDSTINLGGYADFSSPIVYTIHATDGSTAQYTVNVTQRPANNRKDFIAYALENQIGEAVIDPYSHTVKIGIDTIAEPDLTNLLPLFVISENAFATDEDSIIQESNDSYRDFSDTVKYDIYAEDYSMTRWNVIPVLGEQPLNMLADFQAFHFFVEGESVTINSATRTITVSVPTGTDVSAIVAWFTLSKGASAKVNGITQISGTSTLNFQSAVNYIVTSEDGITTKEWTIQATFVNSEKNILTYSLPGQKISSINPVTRQITVYMPEGTSVYNLAATFTLSIQATAKVNNVEQVSGITTNNFTTPVHYTITAGDGSTEEWTVSISFANSINEKDLDINIAAYPNPNNGSFAVKLNTDKECEAVIEIISVDGKRVYSKQIYVVDETYENINLQVDKGTYILRVIIDEAVSNQLIQIIQ